MTDFFSPDYVTARDRFRHGVLNTGGQIESIRVDAAGPRGDDLTIDVGWFGSSAPRRAFIHSSGLHGVEGFAGSAIQLQWLEEGIGQVPDDGAIAIVHALNPYGMAWLRRADENNVDLNHNFLGTDEDYSGAPEHYAALNAWLNPVSPPAPDAFRLRALGKVLRYGMPALRAEMTEGQYDFPAGLSFGGRQHAQATRRFQIYLSGRLAFADRLVGVDVHTGPGPFGEGAFLLAGAEPTGHSSGANRGTLGSLYCRMFPGAKVHFATQEFGTGGTLSALAALRAENRHHHYGGAAIDHPAKEQLLNVFCPRDDRWRKKVLARGKEVIDEARTLAFA